MIGKKILHYKILEKLGQGGMGVVYLAEDSKLERQVAIKFLPHHISANSDERKRFEIEAKAAAALNHPNIATIHAIEETDDQIFLVMEYIEGRELNEIVRANDHSPLPMDRIINYAIQIAEGLQAAHKKGIVHRDIKPSNIMVTNEDKVKIMDFGLAKIGIKSDLTKTKTTLGTISYMSPEQVTGENVDFRSDIWSVGVILYELLTGELPFQGGYEAAIMYQILNEEPPSIKQFRNDIPEEIEFVVKTLLQKDKNKRPESAELIIEHIEFEKKAQRVEKSDNSIAVLYFENMSPDKENEYFCAGITEDIIIDLSKIRQLKVIPRSDVLPFRSGNSNSREIGEILGVNFILEGSVRKAGQQVRVTTQLIDIQSGFPKWSERYDRKLEDIFDVQIELSQKIAESLKISLSDSEKDMLAKKPTDDLRAYDFYMRGREYLIAGGRANNLSAIKMFEQALVIDPNYALAHVGLAEAYSDQYRFYDGNQKWLGKIIVASEKAILLDPSLQEVNTIKALVLFYQKRFSESMETLEKFIEQRDDYYPAFYQLGLISQITKDYDSAIKYFKRASELKPYSEEPWLHMEMTYRRMGDIKGCNTALNKTIEIIQKKLLVNKQDATAMSRLAAVLANMGDEELAIKYADKVIKIEPNDGQVLYNAACTYALLGEKDRAFTLLQQAIAKGYNNVIEWVENDPDFKEYRDDLQFREIIAKAGK